MELQAENTSSILEESRSIQHSHHYDTSCEILPVTAAHYQQPPLPAGPPAAIHLTQLPNIDQRSLSIKGSSQGDRYYHRHDGGSSTGGSAAGYPPAIIGSPSGGSCHLYQAPPPVDYEYPMGGVQFHPPPVQYPVPTHHGMVPPQGGAYHIPPHVQQPPLHTTGHLQPNRAGPPTYKDLTHSDKPNHQQNGKVSIKHIADEPCSVILRTDVCLFLSIALSAICIFCGAYVLFCTIPAIFLTFLAKKAQKRGESAILEANLRITSFCIIAAFVVWLIFTTFIIFMVALTT